MHLAEIYDNVQSALAWGKFTLKSTNSSRVENEWTTVVKLSSSFTRTLPCLVHTNLKLKLLLTTLTFFSSCLLFWVSLSFKKRRFSLGKPKSAAVLLSNWRFLLKMQSRVLRRVNLTRMGGICLQEQVFDGWLKSLPEALEIQKRDQVGGRYFSRHLSWCLFVFLLKPVHHVFPKKSRRRYCFMLSIPFSIVVICDSSIVTRSRNFMFSALGVLIDSRIPSIDETRLSNLELKNHWLLVTSSSSFFNSPKNLTNKSFICSLVCCLKRRSSICSRCAILPSNSFSAEFWPKALHVHGQIPS